MSQIETVNLNARDVPKEIKVKFKMWCIEKNITMQDAIIALIDMAVERNWDLKRTINRRKKKDAKSNGDIAKE